ncbi:MAG: oxygenase [Frankia sp.]
MTVVNTPASGAAATAGAPENPSAAGRGDFHPGRFALRDAWFPVVHSRLVGRRPVLRPIHGQPIYLWRENGVVHASEDSPADRERGRRRASEFTAGSGLYPMTERYGYAWVWYGAPEAASPDLIPHLPHLPVEGGLPRHFLGNVVLDCSYELICENLLDLTHADFRHSWQQRVAGSEISVSSTSETVTMARFAADRPIAKGQRRKLKADRQDFRMVTLVHVRSGVCILYGSYEPGMSVRMLHPANPESPTRTRTTVTFNMKRLSPLARHLSPFAGHLIARQDNWAVRPQNRRYVHSNRGVHSSGSDEPDMNSRFDAGSLRYRKVYEELVSRQRRGDYSYLADGDPARDVASEIERG